MRVYNHTNKCGHRNPTRGEVEKRFAEIEALYIKRAKKLDVTFTAVYNSYHLVIDCMFYGGNGIDSWCLVTLEKYTNSNIHSIPWLLHLRLNDTLKVFTARKVL